MDVAEVVARRGTCPRAKVGAVLVDVHNRLISSGYNGSPPGLPHCVDVGCEVGPDGGCQRAFHAEQNALFFAGVREAAGGTLYTTISPCYTCAKLIVTAGVKRVVYSRLYRVVDGVPDAIEYLRDCDIVVETVQ